MLQYGIGRIHHALHAYVLGNRRASILFVRSGVLHAFKMASTALKEIRVLSRARILVATIFVGLAPGIEAQTIRGTILDERAMPLPGVLVQLLNSRQDVVARSLSNERGEYRLSASTEGDYRVRTQRIGFRPLSYGPFALRSGDEVTQQFTLAGLPVTLRTVSVVGQNPCRSLGDSSSTIHLVWEQARTALTAAEMGGSGRGTIATTVVYDRTLDPQSRHTMQQSSSVHSDYVRQPWRSLSPDSLRRAGYILREADGSTTYHAPGLAARRFSRRLRLAI